MRAHLVISRMGIIVPKSQHDDHGAPPSPVDSSD
jgi:hypothetical protein